MLDWSPPSRRTLNTPEIETCEVVAPLHSVTRRCQDVRNAALPMLCILLAYRFPGGRTSKEGYYHLPDDLSPWPNLNQNMKFKVSTAGILFASKRGRNFNVLRHENGRYYDILDLWQIREEKGTTLLEACDQLSKDIWWLKRESLTQREERIAAQEALDEEAKRKTYDSIRYDMSRWMQDDPVGTVYDATGRWWYTYHGEQFSYPLSSYQYRDMLRVWEKDKSDLWFTVEEVELRKSFKVFRLIKTAVTNDTVKERRRLEKERLEAEKQAEAERQRAEMRAQDDAEQEARMRKFELEEQKREDAAKQVADRLQSLRARYRELEAQQDAALASGKYLVELTPKLNSLHKEIEPLFQSTRSKDQWWTLYRWLKED